MDQVAPFLVSRICTHPSLLVESCRFLSVSPEDFISVTLNRTLPQLFASCETKVLDEISNETGKTLASLFINHSYAILAHVFCLQGPGQTHKVLLFILNILKEAAGDVAIDMTSVVRSCIVPLLAELVIVLGDDDLDRAETVGIPNRFFTHVLTLWSGYTCAQKGRAVVGFASVWFTRVTSAEHWSFLEALHAWSDLAA